MSRFDLVDDAGAPAEYMPCPFCPDQIMIGHYVPKGGRPTPGLAVIHSTSSQDKRTGCETFDKYDDPADFLELALPRMIARAALDSLRAARQGARVTDQVAAGVVGCSCIGCGMARRKAAAGVPPEGECGSCDSPAETCELIIGGHSNGWCRRCLERAGHVLPQGDA